MIDKAVSRGGSSISDCLFALSSIGIRISFVRISMCTTIGQFVKGIGNIDV